MGDLNSSIKMAGGHFGSSKFLQKQKTEVPWGKISFDDGTVELPVKPSFIIGKNDDCDRVGQSPLLSKYHVKLTKGSKSDTFFLEDLSTNGTDRYVSDKLVETIKKGPAKEYGFPQRFQLADNKDKKVATDVLNFDNQNVCFTVE